MQTAIQIYNSLKTESVNFIQKFDHIKLGSDVIKFTATACAVIVGVVTYLWTAFQLWWVDNGDNTKEKVTQFYNRMFDVYTSILKDGPELYADLKLYFNRTLDAIYYTFATDI